MVLSLNIFEEEWQNGIITSKDFDLDIATP